MLQTTVILKITVKKFNEHPIRPYKPTHGQRQPLTNQIQLFLIDTLTTRKLFGNLLDFENSRRD